MAYPSITEYFNSLYATTQAKIGRSIIDQVYKKMPLLYRMEGKMRSTVEGGRFLAEPIRTKKNTSAKTFGRGASFSDVDMDAVTLAKFEMVNVGISLTRFWQDEQENSGPEASMNLVKENIENSAESLRDEIQTQLWATSQTTGNITPLSVYVANAPTTGTVAGLNRATEDYWRNQYKDSSADGSAYTYLLKQMRDLVILCETWGKVDYIVCGSTAYSIYDDVALEQKMITDKSMGDAEFANISWRGVPLVLDTYAPAASMYFIDTATLKWRTGKGAYFTWTPWKDIPHKLDKVAQYIARCELTCNKPRANGVLFSITA